MGKMMINSWEKYVWEIEKETTDGEIISIEERLKIKFPKTYKKVIKANQGKTPVPNIIKDEERETSVSVFLTITEDDESINYNILNTFNHKRRLFKNKMIPFAETGDGDLICFDYRTNDREPEIVLFEHENESGGFSKIMSNFDDFLNALSAD